jgi:hypothetical protein
MATIPFATLLSAGLIVFNQGEFMFKHLFIAAIASILAACGGGGADANLIGNWSGTASSTVNGTPQVQTINLSLSQNSSTVNGTFSGSNGVSGSVVGTFNGTSFEGSFLPSVPSQCPIKIVVFYTTNKLEGTAATYSCTVAVSYTISIRR